MSNRIGNIMVFSDSINSSTNSRTLKSPLMLSVIGSVVFFVIAVLVGFYLFVPHAKFNEIIINDSTGKIDQTLLKSEIEKLNTGKDANVLVYVQEGEEVGNLNDDTYQFVKEEHPELISGNYWTDGWFIVNLNITSGDSAFGSGQIGTYYGEDIKISLGEQNSSQSSGYESFRNLEWTQGLINVIDYSAKKMGFSDNYILWVFLYITIVFLLLVFVIVGSVQINTTYKNFKNSKRTSEELNKVINDIKRQQHVLRGSYGDKVNDTYVNSLKEYESILKDATTIEGFSFIQQIINNSKIRKTSDSISTIQNNLNIVKSVVDLLNKNQNWKDVWNTQISSLKNNLNVIIHNNKNEYTIGEVKYAQSIFDDLINLEKDLFKNKLDMNNALKTVEKYFESLSTFTKKHMDSQLESMSDSKASYVRKYVNNAYDKNDNIWFFYYPYVLYSPLIYNSGYTSGISAYNSAQESSSSSSNNFNSSYSASSGGFSGSGSSSSF